MTTNTTRGTNVPNQETVPPMPNIVAFYHGVFANTYEEQANEQGYTFGEQAEWIEKVACGIICGHIHGIITDSEYDRIMQKFQKKILLKYIKRLESEE